jgi:hypothetical protein
MYSDKHTKSFPLRTAFAPLSMYVESHNTQNSPPLPLSLSLSPPHSPLSVSQARRETHHTNPCDERLAISSGDLEITARGRSRGRRF